MKLILNLKDANLTHLPVQIANNRNDAAASANNNPSVFLLPIHSIKYIAKNKPTKTTTNKS